MIFIVAKALLHTVSANTTATQTETANNETYQGISLKQPQFDLMVVLEERSWEHKDQLGSSSMGHE